MNAIRNEIMYSVFLQRSKYQQLLDKKHGDDHIIGVIHGLEIVETILLEAEAAQDKQQNHVDTSPNNTNEAIALLKEMVEIIGPCTMFRWFREHKDRIDAVLAQQHHS